MGLRPAQGDESRDFQRRCKLSKLKLIAEGRVSRWSGRAAAEILAVPGNSGELAMRLC